MVVEIDGYWVSRCNLCVDGEVKTKCPEQPEQGTGVGEKNRSLKRHEKRLADKHGEGKCNVIVPQDVGSGGADAVSTPKVTATIIAAAADEDTAAASDGLPAKPVSQVSICALCSRQVLHFHPHSLSCRACTNCPPCVPLLG